MKHGASAYRRKRCGCEQCRDDHRVRARAERAARALRLAQDRTLAPHGHPSTYINWDCRCEPCTAANTAACAARVKASAR
jgi:hypothetical protein